LVERAGERRPLAGEERVRIEHVVARGPADAELIPPDAEVLLRLGNADAGRLGGGEAFLRGALGRAHGRLELAQLAFERYPGPVGRDPGLGDLGGPTTVGPEVPAEADE